MAMCPLSLKNPVEKTLFPNTKVDEANIAIFLKHAPFFGS